jgi:hypothetical protein
MSRIEQLRQNMLAMSPDELREHIRGIRNDRRVLKRSPKVRKAKVVRVKKTADILSKLTPMQRELLLAELEKEATT